MQGRILLISAAFALTLGCSQSSSSERPNAETGADAVTYSLPDTGTDPVTDHVADRQPDG